MLDGPQFRRCLSSQKSTKLKTQHQTKNTTAPPFQFGSTRDLDIPGSLLFTRGRLNYTGPGYTQDTALQGLKSVLWFGDIDGPKPYEFIGSGGFYFANTGSSLCLVACVPGSRRIPDPGGEATEPGHGRPGLGPELPGPGYIQGAPDSVRSSPAPGISRICTRTERSSSQGVYWLCREVSADRNPYEFIGFGAMDGPKPYECIGFGAMDGPDEP